MKPIIFLAIITVAGITLGTGFLNNDIQLWIQEFGVGAGDVTSPVEHAFVDFHIAQIKDQSTGYFKNRIDKCIVTLDQPIGDKDNTAKDSEIICKLTGKKADALGNWVPSGQVIAEGKICAPSFTVGPHTVTIGAATGCDVDDILGPDNVDVKAVGDVILVVHANTYSMVNSQMP